MEDVDGSGFSLTIPALLIDTFAAETIERAAQDASSIIKLKASMQITPSESKIAEVSLWYSQTHDLPKKLIEQLYDYQHLLASFVKFTPHILTMQCPECVYDVIKGKSCVSDGLYCLMPINEEFNSKFNVTDEAVLIETLYGRCLQELVQNEQQDLLSFFNYMYIVRKECFRGHSLFGYKSEETVNIEMMKECALHQVKQVGQDPRDVETCVEESFQIPGNNKTDNYLLNGDKLLAEIYGISIHPAVTINGQIYRGDLTGYDVFRAICASFSQGFMPYECLKEFDI